MTSLVELVRGSATLRELCGENDRLRAELAIVSGHAVQFVGQAWRDLQPTLLTPPRHAWFSR